MRPDELFAALDALSPLRLAGSWDNVGLLLEGHRAVERVGLCIDLTGPVLDELLAADVDLVVAYHPPLFGGVRRLVESHPRDRTLLRAIRAGLHVWSPHSALDAAVGGMADWLLEAFEVRSAGPIAPDPLDPSQGAGRLATLARPVPVAELVEPVRRHLGLSTLRLAGEGVVSTVAVCPGAGGSLFEGVRADLLLTGEMRHHDVLAQVERGGAVLLTDHTHTERGYLPRYAARIEAVTGLPVVRSTRCHDPLRVVS